MPKLPRRTLIQAGAATGAVAGGGGARALLETARPAAAAAGKRVDPVWEAIIDAGVTEYSSPLMYDVDGDGKDEIICATTWNQYGGLNNKLGTPAVYVVRPDGTVYQTLRLVGNTTVDGSVTLAKLLPTDEPFLLVPTMAEVDTSQWNRAAGGIQAFRLNPATKRFEFAFKYDAVDDGPDGRPSGVPDPVRSTPCVADVDNDGVLEVFFGGFDRYVHLIKPSATQFTSMPGWPIHVKDSVWSSGVAADVDGDGNLELIIGMDISANPAVGTQDGGYYRCYRANGQLVWERFITEVVYSSPLVADVDGDGKLEVVCGTGDFFGIVRNGGNPREPYIYCLDATNGQVKWRSNVGGFTWSSPATADILQKTNPDTRRPVLGIAATTYRGSAGSLHVIDGSDGAIVSSTAIVNSDGTANSNTGRISPLIVRFDYDNDGSPEPVIFCGAVWDIVAVTFKNKVLNQVTNYATRYSVFGTPLLCDADKDGKLELYIGCSSVLPPVSGTKAALFRFNVETANGTQASTTDLPWPMFRRTISRQAVEPPSEQRSPIIVTPGSSDTFKIPIPGRTSAGGTTQFNLLPTFNGGPLPPWVSIVKKVTIINGSEQVIAEVTINKLLAPPGFNTFVIEVAIVPTALGVTVTPTRAVLPVTFSQYLLGTVPILHRRAL